MRTHELKVHPQFWLPLRHRSKTFDVRRDDRGFKVGDRVILREYSNDIGYMPGETIHATISYILYHEELPNGLQPGYVVLGLAILF